MFFLYSLSRISAGYIKTKCWNEISCVLDCVLFKLTSSHCFMWYDSGITRKLAHFHSRGYTLCLSMDFSNSLRILIFASHDACRIVSPL